MKLAIYFKHLMFVHPVDNFDYESCLELDIILLIFCLLNCRQFCLFFVSRDGDTSANILHTCLVMNEWIFIQNLQKGCFNHLLRADSLFVRPPPAMVNKAHIFCSRTACNSFRMIHIRGIPWIGCPFW